MPLICIASPKGGVGKTTLSANLAHLLARPGRSVVALDLDPQNSLRLHFGMPVSAPEGFAAELPARPSWRAALREAPSGTLLLPHGALGLRGALDNAVELHRNPDLLAAPVREMLVDPDVLVVADMPPGPSPALAILAPLANLTAVVLRSEAISAAMLADIEAGRFLGHGTLKALVSGRLQFLLNDVDLRDGPSRLAAEAVARHLGSRLLGAVSRDEAIGAALASQRLLGESNPASRALRDLRDVAAGIEALLAAQGVTAPRPRAAVTPPPTMSAMAPPAAPQSAAPPAAAWAAPQWGAR
jgi:cellulose synthase operon protein YhjQ